MIYVIIGCHRSGTSMTAGLLHKSGISMGTKWKPQANKENPKGFFEDADFREINEKILKHTEYDVKSWEIFIPDTQVKRGVVNKARRLIEKRNNTFDNWGFKDPRTCLTWGLWSYLLPQDRQTHIVYVYRNPLSVAHSFIKRGNIDNLEHGFMLWYEYNKRCLDICNEGGLYTAVSYEQVLEDKGIKELGIYSESFVDVKLNRADTSGEIPKYIEWLYENIKML